MEKPIAFIADRLEAARIDIQQDYDLVSIRDQRRGVIRKDGIERDFVIVQFPDQLRGLIISEFVFLPSAGRMKAAHEAEMRLIAQSRIR
jgi:hypothetical protein